MLDNWEGEEMDGGVVSTGRCDACGAPLAPEDEAVHLCKVCQGMEDE